MSQAVSAADTGTLRVKIAGMDCGSCALTIENSIRQLPGVRTVAVSFTTESMEVSGDTTLEIIERRLRELGYRLAGDRKPGAAAPPERRGLAGFLAFLWEQPRLRVALLVSAGVALGLLTIPSGSTVAGFSILEGIFWLAVLIAGTPVFIKGFRALLFARRVTIDFLMAIATIGALLIGEGGEAVTVILLYTLGEALEAYSAGRARDSLRSLLSLQPQEATVLREHRGGHGDEAVAPAAKVAHEPHDHHDHGEHHDHDAHQDQEHGGNCSGDHDHEPVHQRADDVHYHQSIVDIDELVVGETVLVRPGQRIPIDGVITKGLSSINQAAVTGESMPVARAQGDEVLAGTVNGAGALEIRVTKPAGDSTIARIAKLVEEAQAQRSPAERFIDRFARWYTPAVVAMAVLVVAIPVLAFGQPLLDTLDGNHGWLYRGLALLIIACPCALVISIPVTVVSALTRLANLGVVVKGGAQLDKLADVRAVAFDKTGTLTRGRPAVTAVLGVDCSHGDLGSEICASCDDVMALAASVEGASEHPVAHAIIAAANVRQLHQRYQPAAGVTAHAGRGITGQLTNGMKVAVGSDALVGEHFAGHREIATRAHVVREAGNTVMFVARDDKVVGYIGVQDEIRPGSREALASLHRADPPVRAVMLTGDNARVAELAAQSVGNIDEVRAGLLPEGKLHAIEELRQRYGKVAMVGDGINDAPALARADVGIAMGAGTAQAMETADVVLMQDDLAHVAMALRVARKSRRFVKQNIALSLGLKLVFLALAIPGFTTLWMAVLADVGATMLVTLNGMRILRES